MNKLFTFLFVILCVNLFSQDTVYYKIQGGETLYKLSQIYEVSVESLQEQNQLKGSKIQKGQTIKIFRKKTLSKGKIEYNKLLYKKETLEKQKKDNLNYKQKELERLKDEKAQLDFEKDASEMMSISKSTKQLKDSIDLENKKIATALRSLDAEIENIDKSKIPELKKKNVPNKKAVETKKKESKPVVQSSEKEKHVNESKELKEKQKIVKDSKTKEAKKSPKKKNSKHKKRQTKDKKFKSKSNKNNKKKKVKATKSKPSNKTTKSNKKQKSTKNSKEKEISSVVIIDDEVVEEKSTSKSKQKKAQNNTNKKISKEDKEQIALVKNECKTKIDSLNQTKKDNFKFLNTELKEIKKEKAKYNKNKDDEKALNLTVEIIELSDSIIEYNHQIDMEIEALKDQKQLLSNKKDSVLKLNEESVFDTNTDFEELNFDSETKIDTQNISKQDVEKLNKSIAKEDTSEIAMTGNVTAVEVKKSKKKLKYAFGDEVDKVRKEKAMFFLSRAKIEIDNKNITKAKDYIDKSLKLNPSYVDAYVLKGDIFSSFSFFDKALNQYNKASILDPENAQLHYNLGNCFIRLENEKRAMIEWSRAIELDGNYILAYVGRASIYLKNGKYKAAVRDYNKIFEINKYFYPAYKGRGVAYLELGDFGKSIIDFNNYLEFEADDPFVFWKRGLAKLYDNNIYDGCIDLLSASEFGSKAAERALKKHCEK